MKSLTRPKVEEVAVDPVVDPVIDFQEGELFWSVTSKEMYVVDAVGQHGMLKSCLLRRFDRSKTYLCMTVSKVDLDDPSKYLPGAIE